MSDLADVAAIGAEALAATGADPQVSIRIEEEGSGSLSYVFEDVDSFRNYPEIDLPRIAGIRIDLGDLEGPVQVAIRAQRDIRRSLATPAVQMSVQGTDRVWVEGLATRLHDKLQRGQRWPTWLRGDWFLLPAIGLTIGLAVAGGWGAHVVGLAHHHTNDESDNWEIAGIAFGLALGIAALFALAWLQPGLELLAQGERTRIARFRKGIVAGIVAIGLSLAASVIYTHG